MMTIVIMEMVMLTVAVEVLPSLMMIIMSEEEMEGGE